MVGTFGSDVLEVDKNNKLVRKVVQGHYKGVQDKPEIWGCATHPTKQIFASCGADKTVRIWDATSMLGMSEQFEYDVTALSWSPNGKFIAVGDRGGQCIMMDAETLTVLGSKKSALAVINNKQNPHAWVEDIKFSPDGTRVSIGTHGGRGKVEVIQISAQGKPGQKIDTKLVFSSAITGMDWSLDGNVI
jgi:WD40 repeat protein